MSEHQLLQPREIECYRSEVLRGRRVALVANTGWYLFNFRYSFLRQLRNVGADVILICPRDRYSDELQSDGFRVIDWSLSRKGLNPFRDLESAGKLLAIYRDIRPDIVHHFTIKCVLYGSWSARALGIPQIVNSVTGLGSAVLSKSIPLMVLRPLLIRLWAKTLGMSRAWALFQANDDRIVLARYCQRLAETGQVVGGSGVNLAYFSPTHSNIGNDRVNVVFIGRLIAQKGVREFVDAANRIRERQHNIEFVACGDLDEGNATSISQEEFATWKAQGAVDFYGHVDDIRKVIDVADIVVLPSYREGTPRVLLEASAMAKAVVATNVPGCRDVVVDGATGILVPPQNVDELVAAILDLATNKEKREAFGRAGREYIAKQFSDIRVNNAILHTYERAILSHHTV